MTKLLGCLHLGDFWRSRTEQFLRGKFHHRMKDKKAFLETSQSCIREMKDSVGLEPHTPPQLEAWQMVKNFIKL
jgi:hypothetical protein